MQRSLHSFPLKFQSSHIHNDLEVQKLLLIDVEERGSVVANQEPPYVLGILVCDQCDNVQSCHLVRNLIMNHDSGS